MAKDNIISTTENQLILFSLGKGYYAIPIENVFEIKKIQEITVVPKSPKYIEGVINLRGNVVPIINLRKRFGMELVEFSKKNKIIIVEVGKRQFGLIVDAVAEVIVLNNDQVESTLPTSSGLKAEFIKGIGKLVDKLIIILDITRILQSNEEIRIEA